MRSVWKGLAAGTVTGVGVGVVLDLARLLEGGCRS
jgi:hypothetical protein